MASRDKARGPGSRIEETRGRKAQPKAPVLPLPVRPPGLVTKGDFAAYTRLRKQLLKNSRIGEDDTEMVVQVAILQSDFERLRKEVAKLKNLTTMGGNGNDRVHPLVDSMLKIGAAYRLALGQLLMTPRSRSASRLAKTQTPGTTGAPGVIPATTPEDLRLFGS